jgi:hypothetical protein
MSAPGMMHRCANFLECRNLTKASSFLLTHKMTHFRRVTSFRPTLTRLLPQPSRKPESPSPAYCSPHNPDPVSHPRQPAEQSVSTPGPTPTPATQPVPRGDDLPPGWELRFGPRGRPYYVDHNTRRTTCTRLAARPSPAVAPQSSTPTQATENVLTPNTTGTYADVRLPLRWEEHRTPQS